VQKLFSTKELHPRDRFDCWHEVACKNIVDHSSSPQSRQTFQAELEGASLADIGLVLYEISPMEISRTKQHIANANSDDLLFTLQIAGSFSLEQAGREATLTAGDMVLRDPMVTYTGQFPLGSRSLVIKVPRRPLEARTGKLLELTAIALKPDVAENRVTSSFLAMLPAHAGQIGPEAQEILREQTLDLIALSLAKTVEARPRLSGGHACILLNIRAIVEARLADPNLNVKTIADAAGVSVRYANSLLAAENTSLMRLIQTRRLRRCRKALEDPSQARRPVSEIAYSWGFSDMTHFGRAFKKAYGVLPSEYRRRSKANSFAVAG